MPGGEQLLPALKVIESLLYSSCCFGYHLELLLFSPQIADFDLCVCLVSITAVFNLSKTLDHLTRTLMAFHRFYLSPIPPLQTQLEIQQLV